MSSDKQTEHKTNIDSLCSRPAYITSISQFLNEIDTLKALAYWLTEFSDTQSLKDSQDIVATIHRSIAEIDHLINDQVNAIIHQPQFQKLEASWRGLWYLAVQADGTRNIKIKLLDISWAEVSRDISRSLDFDQSQLFKKIYNDEYGTP
ncbi:MAG: type VI secretion system contractile sheath large subunit, partial [Gammaproteobacteria bacterium]|nr:type VI secretion system contractile sheath large subunit [Gammaproteobacteria bacterium]